MMSSLYASGAYPVEQEVRFTGAAGSGAKGKQADNSATRAALGWQPRWPSFKAFMEQGAKDWYSQPL